MAALLVAACNGGSGGGDPDAAAVEASDAGVDGAADAAADAAVDAAPTADATVDAGAEAPVDASVDAIPDAPCPATLPSGTYLLGADIGLIVPMTVQFLVTVDYRPGDGCHGVFDASTQPLTRSTRVPTGDPIVSRDVAIDAAGAFVLPVAGTIPADASPIPSALGIEGELTGTAGGEGACGRFSVLVDILSTRLEGPFAMIPVDPAAPLPPALFECPTP
jgi:hypothetical protein